jgi:transposase-like protein
MNCPKCSSENHCKDGIVKGRQRYKCKDCCFHYTVERKSDVKSADTKRLAFEMYLEGLGFRSTGRILKISYGTVYQWIKKWGSNMTLPKRKEEIEVVELDEMHTYVGRKKTIVGYGLLLIDMENGFSLLSVGTGRQKQD